MDDLTADLEKLERGVLPGAVGEMMARSGGFNVPADYFRSSAMPAPVPASPASPKARWPLYATIGAVGTVVGIVAVIMARSSSSPAQTPAPVALVAPAAAPPVPVAAAMSASPATAPPLTHEVLVTVVPSDATISRDGADLGRQPIVLHLGAGEAANLVLARKGYKSKPVKVDSTDGKQEFTLDPVYTARPASTPKPTGGGGIDDVGDPFAAKR